MKRELTSEEKKELDNFIVNECECGHQVLLAMIAVDGFEEDELKKKLTSRQFYDAYIAGKRSVRPSEFWAPELLCEWAKKLALKCNNTSLDEDERNGVAMAIFESFCQLTYCGMGKEYKKLVKLFECEYNEYLAETGCYLEDSAEQSYRVIMQMLEEAGIPRTPVVLEFKVNATKMPLEFAP